MKARLISHRSVLALVLAASAGAACTTASSADNTPSGGSGGVKGDSTTPSGKGGGGGSTTNVTTGAGGTIVPPTGGGGTGGPMIMGKLCAMKTTVMNPVLINFDTYTGTVTAAQYGTAFGSTTANMGTAYTGPYAYGDGSGTLDLEIKAGYMSPWAVEETVAAAKNWGMGGGIWMYCANASAYKGISFWVRGTSTLGVFSFTVAMENTVMPDATNAANGGTCPGASNTCIPATKTDIPLTADWTQQKIMWADFTPGMAGSTLVTPNGDNITGLGWSVPLMYTLDPSAMGDAAGPYVAVQGDLLIDIDDIEFIP